MEVVTFEAGLAASPAAEGDGTSPPFTPRISATDEPVHSQGARAQRIRTNLALSQFAKSGYSNFAQRFSVDN
jgi:hypothetical protein